MTDKEPTRRKGGRPTRAQADELDRRIRQCALETLLEHGYEGTSMSAIAAASETTKPTLYARFPTKEALFLEVLGWAIGRSDWPTPEPTAPDLDDLAGALAAVADAAVSRALHPSMIRLEQIAIAHAATYPELARSTYGSGTWPRRSFVADVLRKHAESGEIVADDPEQLADLFLGMTSGSPARLASFGIVHSPARQRARTRAAVELFLRGLRP